MPSIVSRERNRFDRRVARAIPTVSPMASFAAMDYMMVGSSTVPLPTMLTFTRSVEPLTSATVPAI